MTCSKFHATKTKYNKSLESQWIKGEIKTSFDFTVILCKYLSKNGIKSSIQLPPSLLLPLGTGE